MTDLPTGYEEYLLSDDAQKVQVILRALSHRPTGDPRVLPCLEKLLDDRRPCVISLPIFYGELRFRAAEALAAERKAQGIREQVRLAGVVIPLTPTQLHRLAKAAGLPLTGDWQALFERLREMGILPQEDLELNPEEFEPGF